MCCMFCKTARKYNKLISIPFSGHVAGVSLPSTPYCAIQAATWPLALASCTHEAMNLAASGIPFLQPTLCKENVVILCLSSQFAFQPVEFGFNKFYNNLHISMNVWRRFWNKQVFSISSTLVRKICLLSTHCACNINIIFHYSINVQIEEL